MSYVHLLVSFATVGDGAAVENARDDAGEWWGFGVVDDLYSEEVNLVFILLH